MDAREILSEILAYYKKKVDDGLCTMEEMDAAAKVLMENMDVYGSISDFAKFYGVPEVNVRNAIHRKLLAGPKRVVLYPFHKFSKVVPEKWRKKFTNRE